MILSRQPGYFLPELLVSMLTYLTVLLCCAISLAPIIISSAVKPEAIKLELVLRQLILASSQYESDIEFNCGDKTCQANIKNENKILLVHSFSEKISLSLRSSKPNLIIFFKSGTVSPATITISDKFKSCSIVISLLGRIRSTC
jgi:hypothetical protein